MYEIPHISVFIGQNVTEANGLAVIPTGILGVTPSGGNIVATTEILSRSDATTNYQLMPGDRVYVKADHWISTDAWINKRLAPIERVLGATLLGSETVNSIRSRGTGTGGSSP